MELILDLAVAAVSIVVVVSLGLLAWTLGVTAVRSIHQARTNVALVDRRVVSAGSWMRPVVRAVHTTLERVDRFARQPRRQGDE